MEIKCELLWSKETTYESFTVVSVKVLKGLVVAPLSIVTALVLITNELSLYDAACGLARALNEGHFINSKDVIELMNSEVAYTSAVNDMVLYKHHLKKNPNSARATLYETRYSEAKRKAISAKERVSILAESF